MDNAKDTHPRDHTTNSLLVTEEFGPQEMRNNGHDLNETTTFFWRVPENKHLIHHLHMSLSLLLLFISFNSMQNLMSSLIGSLGFVSLALIYGSLCVSSFLIGPAFVTYFKPRISFVVGSACYASFIFATRWPSAGSLVPTALLVGIGGSILWTAQGTYLTQAATNYALKKGQPKGNALGSFTGIFFAVFQINQIVGNLIAGFILSSPTQGSQETLGYIFMTLASLSVLSLCFIVPEDSPSETRPSSILEKIFKAVILLKDKRLLLLLPVIIYSGMEQGFVFGTFTAEVITPAMGKEKIGFVMTAFGAADVIGSFLLGKIAERYKTTPLVIIGWLFHLVFFVTLYPLLNQTKFTVVSSNTYILYLMAILYGVGDAAWNTFPNILLALLFKEPEAAFSNLKFWQSIGTLVPFIMGAYHVPLLVVMPVLFGFLWMAGASMVYLQILFKVFSGNVDRLN